MKMLRKLVSIVAAATLLTSSLAFSLSANAAETEVDSAVASEPNLQADAGNGVILHAFNWSYNSIKENLPQIAAAGYSTVQTSPVTQPKNYGTSSDVANQWWKLYQPVSLSIAQSSWLGTKAELTALCAEADKYGIKIIVDIVANHMANNVSASGTDIPDQLGPEVATYEPTLYNSYSTYFHTETFSASDDNASTVTRGHVSACPDLNTANSTVQSKILALLKDCIDCGVDGFRFDAAKHIETEDDGSYASNFWVNTLDQAKTYYSQKNSGKQLFAYGEVLNNLGGGRSANSYTKRMRITDNSSGNAVLNGFKNGSASSAAHFGYDLSGSGSKSVLWAESHDTFMGTTGGSTAGVSDQNVTKAWAIVASRKDATALFFARPGSSLMGEAAGDLTYKSTAVSEVNKFHNAFVGQSEKTGYSGSFVYVARGNSGIVIANANGTTANVNISGTGLADGSYVDTVTGNAFTVSGGTLTGSMGSTGVAVVYHSTSTPKVTASVESGVFTDDTMTVQLSLENAVSGTYALENSAPASFTGSPTIRIGSDYNIGETITLNLTATDAAGQTSTSTYYYTKKAPTASGVYVFLKKSLVSRWTNVNCYVYDEDTDANYTYVVAGWPGKAMSEYGDYYYIEVPATCLKVQKNTTNSVESDFDLPNSPNTYVIFNGTQNSATTQYPGSNVPASQKLKLQGGSHVLDAMNASGWKVTTMKPEQAPVQATDVTKGDAPITEPSTDAPTDEPTTEEPTTEEPEPVTEFVQIGIIGDANRDGKVNLHDVTAIQRDVAEYQPRLSGDARILADVDKDGEVTIKDVTCVQMYLAEYAAGYGHTGEPYGEYRPVDPSGEKFTVTATSNLFASSSAKFDTTTTTVTTSFFIKCSKDLLSTDWLLTYDKTKLQLSGTNFMPAVNGNFTYNTSPESVTSGVTGNYADLHLTPLQTATGGQVALVTATFTVLDPSNTTVNLNVKDLNVSKLNSGESTSKSENEEDIVEDSVLEEPSCSYQLVTSIYSGPFNENYVNSKDPKVVYPTETPITDPTNPTDNTDPTDPTDPSTTRTIQFTDNKGWGQAYIYIYGPDGEQAAWPGVPMTMILEDNGFGGTNYAYDIPTDCEFFICNDGQAEGGQQTVNITDDGISTGWYPTEEQDELGHWFVDSWVETDPITDPTDPTNPPSTTRTIEFTDNKGWGTAYIYYVADGQENAAWPGVPMNSKGDNGYGGTNYWYEVPTSTEFMVFNNGLPEGADQTVDVPYDSTSTGWYPTDEKDELGHWLVGSWSDPDPSVPSGTRTILFTDNKGWGSVNIHYWGSASGDTEWPGWYSTAPADRLLTFCTTAPPPAGIRSTLWTETATMRSALGSTVRPKILPATATTSSLATSTAKITTTPAMRSTTVPSQ